MIKKTGDNGAALFKRNDKIGVIKERYDIFKKYCKDKYVCDIACGTGWGSFILSKVASKVKGIDISENNIEFANENWLADNIEYIVGDFKGRWENNYDVIVSSETIEHIDIPIEESIKIYYKNLRKEGMLCLTHPENDETEINQHHHFRIKSEDVLHLLKENGFTIVFTKISGNKKQIGNHIVVAKKK